MSARAPAPEPIMHPKALWDIVAIMAYCRFGQTVVEKLVNAPDFPRPTRPTGPDGHPRWIAGEVWEFFEAKRGGEQSPTP